MVRCGGICVQLCCRVRTKKQSSLDVVAFLVCAFTLCFSSVGAAQNVDDVHVEPQHRPAISEPVGEHAGGLLTEPALLNVQVDVVLVPVVVTDEANRSVMGLKKENFTLYEAEQKQQIQYCSAEDTPISVGIILDLSGTMAGRIDSARNALNSFFQNSHPDDDYFVITFANRPQLIADTSQSTEQIQNSLGLAAPSGHTALLDAVQMGLDKLKRSQYERRALLIISDGGDNWSRHKLPEITTEVEESGVDVYAIGLFNNQFPLLSSLEVAYGKHLLTKLSDSSGGRTVTVNDLRKLSDAAATISKEMRSQYVLGYRPYPALRKGELRKITVRVEPNAILPYGRLHLAYKKNYVASFH